MSNDRPGRYEEPKFLNTETEDATNGRRSVPAEALQDAAGDAMPEPAAEPEDLPGPFAFGDTVETPEGNLGIVVDTHTAPFEWPGGDQGEEGLGDESGMMTVEASEEEPVVIVALESGGSKPYPADELSEGEFGGEDVDPKEAMETFKSEGELAHIYFLAEDPADPVEFEELLESEELQNIPGVDDPHVGFNRWPKNWTRKSLLKFWKTVGGTWRGCYRRMLRHFGPRMTPRFCAAAKDEVLGHENWRTGKKGKNGPGR